MAPSLLTIRSMGRRRARREPPTGIEGSLCYLPARRLVDICRRQRLTGTLRVTSWDRRGRVLVRAGEIVEASYGALRGPQALAEMQALRDGTFELRQALPGLASAPQRAGQVALPAVMAECRERALGCRIAVSAHGRQAALTYRAGALEELRVDGAAAALDHRAAEQALAPFAHGLVRVEALPVVLHEPAVVRSGEISPAARPGPRPVPRALSRRAAPAASRSRGAHAPGSVRPTALPPAAGWAADRGVHRAAPAPGRPGATPPPVPGAAHRPAAPGAAGPSPARPAAAGDMQPWLDSSALSGATASLRGPMSGRRELAVVAVLALFVVSLALVVGFVAFRM